MIIRLSGIIVMFFSAVSYSFTLVKNANQRIRQLENICLLISYIKSNIESFIMPIHDILVSFSGYSRDFDSFIERARKFGLKDAAENSDLDIGKTGRCLLSEFCSRIGIGYKEDELRLCSYYYDQLSQLLEEEKDETGRKMKMYKTLPIMSAISVTLLLL